MSRPPRWFPFWMGAITGPLYGVFFLGASATLGVVVTVIALQLGIIYVLNSGPSKP